MMKKKKLCEKKKKRKRKKEKEGQTFHDVAFDEVLDVGSEFEFAFEFCVCMGKVSFEGQKLRRLATERKKKKARGEQKKRGRTYWQRFRRGLQSQGQTLTWAVR